MQRWVRLLLFAIVFPLLMTGWAQAQGSNLLQDGGFEGTYTSRGRADLNIPQAWSIWVADSPHTQDWMNLPPVAFPDNGADPRPHGGAHSLNLNKDYATFTAAVYQQVSVPTGSNVTGTAWAFLRTCKIPTGAIKCTSSPDSNAFTRIGIDPNGGTNPFDADVVWSANAQPHESWQEMTVSATATGSTVTLFLYTTQQWPEQINQMYWDDASLTMGGSGGVAAAQPGAPTPAPTVPPTATVPSVDAQGHRSDGAVVHVVQAGDTLDSIAYAYGVTRDDLLKLNNISDPRIIQIGQQIIVKAAPTVTAAVTAESTAEASAASTDNATSAVTPQGSSNPSGTPAGTPAGTPTVAPPPEVVNAAPAPVVGANSGTVAAPIDPSDQTASICVTMFEDTNQNRIQDNGEDALAGGNILLTANGTPAGQHTTDDTPDPYCFDKLAAGSYVVQGAAPSDYGLTTPDQLQVQAYPGAHIDVAFGAAQGVQAVQLPTADNSAVASATVSSAPSAIHSPVNSLRDNIGLIVFGVAGVVLITGLGISLILRRR